MTKIDIHHGDSSAVIKTLADCSIDSVVTDPPYALASIVKRFGKTSMADQTDTSERSRRGADGYARLAKGFMGKEWDNGAVAFDPDFWREVLRVLKPGGHILAFGGTRTYHRLAVAIEDAGFEIRDQIGWLYGSGFPKSHDVSKGIDKAACAVRQVISKGEPVKRMIPGADQHKGGWEKSDGREFVPTVTAAASAASAAWEGWGTALKPAWEPIVVARKPIIGTVADNVLQHGTGALNIDDCRVSVTESDSRDVGRKITRNVRKEDDGYGMNTAEPQNSVTVVRPEGRWPANVIHDGSDDVIEAFPDSDGQQGDVTGNDPSSITNNIYGKFNRGPATAARNDSGSAARFFYSAKADSDDRLGSKHPTVKPVDLMRYLCRLITPPGGMVLDPFAGSGSTGVACLSEGFRSILIEREDEYVADIRRRIAWAQGDGALTDGEKVAHVAEDKKRGDDLPLFAAGT